MKKYYFSWYNRESELQEADFVMAKNKKEAKEVAVLVMNYWHNDNYTVNDIDSLIELKNECFHTMDKIKEKYNMVDRNIDEVKLESGEEALEEWQRKLTKIKEILYNS